MENQSKLAKQPNLAKILLYAVVLLKGRQELENQMKFFFSKWTCELLKMYGRTLVQHFNYQLICFQVSVPSNLLQYVQLEPTYMNVNTNIKLMQFDIKNYKFLAFNNSSIVRADIKFLRKIVYHLTNTYLPTISLLIICEMTLFFDESKQEIAITLSLTVMLVMYTFYQVSISKTFYEKLQIKLLCLAFLCLKFIYFCVHF